MRKSAILGTMLLFAFSVSVWAQGTLLLIGGGSTSEKAVKAFIKAAGNADALILILAFTQEKPEEGGARSAEWFRECGAKRVEVLAGSSDALLVKRLGEARGVWIPGGDQKRFMERFPEKSGVPGAIRQVFKRGGVVGGTSAGASLMGARMPSGEDVSEPTMRKNDYPTLPALSIVSKAIFDQHFFRRGRLQRLTGIVLDNPNLTGIGIDQDAWITLEMNLLRVHEGTIALVEADKGRQKAVRVRLLGKDETLKLSGYGF